MAEEQEVHHSAWRRGATGAEGLQPLGSQEDYRDIGGYGTGYEGPPPPDEGPFVGVGPVGWVRPAREIRQDLCRQMAAEGYLDASRVEVTVDRDGVVTLAGTVPSREQRVIAEQLARMTGGVREVHNHLELWGRHHRPVDATSRYGRGARPEDLRRHLAAHVGEPRWAEERRRYERGLYRGGPGPAVSRRQGGRRQGPSAQRIRDEVCQRLMAYARLDASDIDVEVGVRGDEVILRGRVGSREEKRLAEELAEGVPGVFDVHNRLRIARHV